MPPAQFAAVYGQQVANIEQILDSFRQSNGTRHPETSRSLTERVHIPLTQRGAHL